MKRRHIILAAAFSCTALGPIPAFADENFPESPVVILVPFTAGSQVDLVAREIARGLTELWPQPVMVENRPGAGGTVGSAQVAAADADGYTLLFTSASHAINHTLYEALPYDTKEDFVGVTFGTSVPNVLVVAPSLGVESVEDLLELVRDKPGELNFASAGIGSGTHFNGEMFKAAAELDIVHVPYRGTGDALIDTASGTSAYYWSPLGLTLPFIRDDRLIPLAVSTAERAPLMPDVPAISDFIPEVVYDHWYGLMAPGETPRSIVEKISRDVGEVLDSPQTAEWLSSQGVVGAPTTPDDFDAFIASEIDRLGAVVVAADIKIE